MKNILLTLLIGFAVLAVVMPAMALKSADIEYNTPYTVVVSLPACATIDQFQELRALVDSGDSEAAKNFEIQGALDGTVDIFSKGETIYVTSIWAGWGKPIDLIQIRHKGHPEKFWTVDKIIVTEPK